MFVLSTAREDIAITSKMRYYLWGQGPLFHGSTTPRPNANGYVACSLRIFEPDPLQLPLRTISSTK